MATAEANLSIIGGPSSGSNRSGSRGSKRGRKSYRKRDSSEFTEDELQHLENLKKNSLLQRLHFFRVFKEPTEQLRNWLYFFDGSEDRQPHGSELQRGLIQLWSTCIVAEALLAGVATQPFITPQDFQGWKRTWYGILWMLSLLADFFALGTTTLFLGYLLGNPGKLSWIWLCKIGALRGIPAILVLLATFMSLLAIGFTTFILYGWKVGIVCVVFEVIIVAAGTYFAILLSDANNQVIESELQ